MSTASSAADAALEAVDGSFPRGIEEPIASTSAVKVEELQSKGVWKNGESVDLLRDIIAGRNKRDRSAKGAHKYVAIDCEMVGVGIGGQESSLARVSVVNYYGHVLLDEIVQQRERVFDYRTKWSGIRPSDMARAKPFTEVQNKVAELIEGKILVGHAVHNDLKALLLSHPHYLIRDTQVLAGKHKIVNSRQPALRHLVESEFGLAIQEGEHSSVTDARATMAIYRLYRKVWESSLPASYIKAASLVHAKRVAASTSDVGPHGTSKTMGDLAALKRKAEDSGDDDEKANLEKTLLRAMTRSRAAPVPPGGRKGISSGLSTVVKRGDQKTLWWKQL